MENTHHTFQRALVSGTVAGFGVAAAVALAGRRDSGSWAAPLNATSHALWGDEAARHDDASMKYTATGFLLNHASAIFWAALYEKWFGGRNASDPSDALLKPLLGAAAVSAAAYVTDYHLVPRRLTPGWEQRVSGKSLAMTYGVLALGLAACDLIRGTRRMQG